MGKLQNTFNRFRYGLLKMDFLKNNHEDCTNFDNGTYIAAPRIFNFTNLNPKASACPHFRAKKGAETKNRNNDVTK